MTGALHTQHGTFIQSTDGTFQRVDTATDQTALYAVTQGVATHEAVDVTKDLERSTLDFLHQCMDEHMTLGRRPDHHWIMRYRELCRRAMHGDPKKLLDMLKKNQTPQQESNEEDAHGRTI